MLLVMMDLHHLISSSILWHYKDLLFMGYSFSRVCHGWYDVVVLYVICSSFKKTERETD